MKASQNENLKQLAEMLVTEERFSEVQRVAELATVSTLYPELPQAAIYYLESGDKSV
jgi:hypothetical protein